MCTQETLTSLIPTVALRAYSLSALSPFNSMKRRTSAFKEAVTKPTVIKDSRFGLRKLYLNDNEKSTTFSYLDAGRGANGEHQS